MCFLKGKKNLTNPKLTSQTRTLLVKVDDLVKQEPHQRPRKRKADLTQSFRCHGQPLNRKRRVRLPPATEHDGDGTKKTHCSKTNFQAVPNSCKSEQNQCDASTTAETAAVKPPLRSSPQGAPNPPDTYETDPNEPVVGNGGFRVSDTKHTNQIKHREWETHKFTLFPKIGTSTGSGFTICRKHLQSHSTSQTLYNCSLNLTDFYPTKYRSTSTDYISNGNECWAMGNCW